MPDERNVSYDLHLSKTGGFLSGRALYENWVLVSPKNTKGGEEGTSGVLAAREP